MIGAIHHVRLRVADVAEASRRWSRLLGLSGDADGDRALLRCAYEDFCLHLEPGEPPGLEHVAYELLPGVSLDSVGGGVEIDVPGRGTGLRLRDPDGNGVVVIEHRARGEEERWPPVARFTDELPAFHPRKLGHVN